MENVGATAFDLPNSGKPRPYNQFYYGNQRVPRPTNSQAKVTNPAAVMRETQEAK